MPFEVMDPRDVSTKADLFHEISIPSETQIGFWNSKARPEHHGLDGMLRGPVNTPLSSRTSWKFMEESSSTVFSKMDQPSFRGDGNAAEISRIQRESSLFSSSLSEAYFRKWTSSRNDLFLKSADCVVSDIEKDKLIQPLKEIEGQTIEYLLPDEDDLFSGVTDELGLTPDPIGGGNLDDYDIFGSGGGLELDGGNLSWPAQRSSEFNEGTTRGHEQHSMIRVEDLIENRFPKQNFSAPNNFPSQLRVASASNPYAVNVPGHSHNRMNFGLHGTIGSQGIENRHIPELVSNGHPRILSGGDIGSLGKKSCPLHGESYGWSNPNSYQYHPPSPMKWQNLPSLMNGVHIHHQPQHSGYPKAATPMQNYHVEASRSVNSPNWDRRIAYNHDTHGFHLGSLGNTGFPSMSPLNSFENASQNISSLGGGNGHIFTGRNPVMSVPTSFESPNERVRFRRKDINSNHGDRKQFELDIDRILLGEDCRTTLMLKNIPNKYTSKMLLASIDEHHQGTYDFIYLPIDFKNKCNVGYAFINMIDPFQIVPFYKNFNGKKWEKFNSEKVASIAYARIQGKAALVTHFQNSSLMNEDKRCRPILFHTDGPNAGDQEPFPMGTNIRSRYGKTRAFSNDEKHEEGSPSTSVNEEESCNETDSSSGSKDLTVGGDF